VTTVALVAAVAVFRVVTVLVFSVAMGALTAGALSWIFASSAGAGTAWAVNVTVLAGEVAAIGLVAALLSMRRLPSIAEVRRIAGPRELVPPVQVLVLAAFAAVALLQVPALLAWFSEDRALLVDMLGGARDSLRLDFVPGAVLYSLPTLAAALLTLFAATSIGGGLATRSLALRFLTAGVVLQVGVLAIGYLLGRGVRDLGAAALRLMADAPAADTAAAVAWIQRHDAVAQSMLPMLTALVIAYVVLSVAAYVKQSTPIVTAVATPSVAGVSAPAVLTAGAQAARIPPVLRSGPTPFDERFYVLRFQPGWRIVGLMLGRRFIEYALQTVPPMSRSEFSFSWSTGGLCRKPGGQEIFRLQAAERHDLLKRAYVVSDAVTGVVIGKLLPHSADWQIVDADERSVADAVQSSASFQQTTWVISAGGEEWGRLVAVMGATAASAEVQIEFLPASDGKLDRSLVIALAPLLEERTRRSRTV
jgi:hypothetical protein